MQLIFTDQRSSGDPPLRRSIDADGFARADGDEQSVHRGDPSRARYARSGRRADAILPRRRHLPFLIAFVVKAASYHLARYGLMEMTGPVRSFA